MRVLLVDAFDSFVHIIKQYLLDLGAEPVMVRSDEFRPALLTEEGIEAILLGPGPGHPAVSGHVEIVRHAAGRLPVLGVCLGHQAIGLAFGGVIERAQDLVHGKDSRLIHDGRGLFAGLPADVRAMRYHSLVVAEKGLPRTLSVTARTEDGYVMGIRHRTLPIEGIQFHPESVGTQFGHRMLGRFLDLAAPVEVAS